MNIQVTIKRDPAGSLITTCDGGSFRLFRFGYNKEVGAWFFNLSGELLGRRFPGARTDFPRQYFIDACRAKYFIQYGQLPDGVEIVKGGGYIGVRNAQ